MLRPGRRLSFAGSQAHAALRLAANVSGTETVTVGAEVYEVNIVNTDSTVNTSNGDLNNTTNPKQVTHASHALTAGSLIRVENEIMKITVVNDTDHYTVSRGHSGTTIAAHADGLDIFKGSAFTAGRHPVGLVTTLTPAAFSAALVAVFNAENALGMTAEATATYEVIFRTTTRKADTTALSEGLAGANNVLEDAAMQGGQLPGDGSEFTIIAKVPSANDVTLGYFFVAVPFTPRIAIVQVITTSSGARKAWDGVMTIDAANKRVKVDNAGSVDWAATDTVYLLAWS